ncbi:MAG: hypothetical protein ACYS91_01275 [Planctomycetota bacterium]
MNRILSLVVVTATLFMGFGGTAQEAVAQVPLPPSDLVAAPVGSEVHDCWNSEYNRLNDHIAVWTIWPRLHSRRNVLSKAPVPSALLKTRIRRVKYSHNTWTKNGGRTLTESTAFEIIYFLYIEYGGGKLL